MFAGVAEQQQDVLEDTAMRIAWEDSHSSSHESSSRTGVNSTASSGTPNHGKTQDSRHIDEKPYVVLTVKLRSGKVHACCNKICLLHAVLHSLVQLPLLRHLKHRCTVIGLMALPLGGENKPAARHLKSMLRST